MDEDTTTSRNNNGESAPKELMAGSLKTLSSNLESLNLKNNFTPSTPYVHKFRTEMCKNFELYGKCKYGNEVRTTIYFKFLLLRYL